MFPFSGIANNKKSVTNCIVRIVLFLAIPLQIQNLSNGMVAVRVQLSGPYFW